MPQFEYDESTGTATLHVKKGAQWAVQKTINTNTVRYDAAGDLVSITFPKPHATMNMAGITFNGSDHDDARRVMDFHGYKGVG